jgi:membrane-associated phospholipid phosphatase
VIEVNSGPAHDAETGARWDAATLMAVGLCAAALSVIVAVVGIGEGHLLHLVTSHREHWTVSAARTLTVVGDPSALIVSSLLAAAALYWCTHRIVMALTPISALLVAGAVTKVGKDLIGRARPPLALHLVVEGGNSTPSGHATDATAFFVAIALVVGMIAWAHPLVGRVASVVAVVFAIGVGSSRLELGVHWPLDVAAGWLLGLGVAIGVVEVGAALDARLHHYPTSGAPAKKDEVVVV